MAGRTLRASTTSTDHTRTRARLLFAAGAVMLGGLLTVAAEAAAPPEYAARASIAPNLYYIGDSAGSVYTFTVKNTGTTKSIGAVEINRPSTWTVTSCPTPPAGWTATASATKCRFRSAASKADDIKPGTSKTFNVKAKTDPGTANRTGTWRVVVSSSYHFDNTSLLKTASPTGAGLTTTLYTFELTTAVVKDVAPLPGTACPAADKDGVIGSNVSVVICGKNRASTALTPSRSYSTLGGTFVQTVGTFATKSIARNSGNVVLANWNATQVAGTYGTDKKVIAGIGASANRRSPLRTFTGYTALSQPPVGKADTYSTDEDTPLVVTDPGVLDNDEDAENDLLTARNITQPANGSVTVAPEGGFTYTPNANFHGTDSFTYTAYDTHNDSDATTVTITVGPVNDQPTVAAVPVTTDEDTPEVVTLDGTDIDGDLLTYSITGDPSHGTLGPVVGNTVTYTPALDYNGADSFTYKVSDGTVDSADGTVSVTVGAVNDAPVAGDDAYSADEDTVIDIAAPGVLGDDSDVDGDALTAALVDDVDHGTLTLNPNGSFTYTPDADYEGGDSFTYKTTDGTLDSGVATVELTLDAVNDAPVAAAVPVSTDEDTAKAVTLSGSDVDGDALTYSIVAGPAHGSVGAVSGDGVTYTPDSNYTGTDTFTYKVNDGTVDSAVATVTVTVGAVNDAPVAGDDSYSTDEDTPLTVAAPGVLGDDSDVEGDALTPAVVAGPEHGDLTMNPDGSFTYTPDANYHGADSFTYTADDADSSNVATVTLTVNSVNDLPVADDQGVSTNEDTAKAVTMTGSDVEGAVTYAIVTGPAHGSLGAVSGDGVTYTPDADYNGSDSFTFKVVDGSGADSNVATVSITVNAVNDAPVAGDDAYSTDEDTALTVPATGVLGDDSDVDQDALSAVLVSGVSHGILTLDADGGFTYTPSANYHGPDSFTYKTNDGAADSNVATVDITVGSVNDLPTASNQMTSTNEDTAKAVTMSGSDVEGAVTYAIVTGPAHGSLGAVSGDGVTYTPDADYHGPDSFTFKVTDGSGADSSAATVSITVNPVNDAPVAGDDAYSTDEDTPLTVTAPGVLGDDSDVDTDPLTAALLDGVDHGTLTLNANGSFTYTPTANYFGADSFTYTVSDGNGGTDTATVDLTVGSVNDVPTASDLAVSTAEDTAKAVTMSGGDVESAVTYAIVTGPTHGSLGAVSGDGVTYTPDADYHGPDSFTYKTNDGTVDSPTATVTITVTPVNDAPVADNDGPFQAIQDQNLALTTPGVLTNDIDVDGDALTAGNASDPDHGTVTLNPDGSFSYDPDTGYTGADSFTYDVSDGTLTDTATVTITVVPPNATPTADATSGSGNEDGGPITVTLTGHDDDGDGLTFDPGTATNGLVTVPTGTSCDSNVPSVCTATVTYTPAANFHGSDSFTYTVNDGTIDSAAATASVTVSPVNDEPSFTKGANQTVNEDAAAQTVNGWATAISAGPANEAAQAVSFTVTTDNDALFAALPAVNSGGDLSFTPAVNANGAATVTVRAVDDGGTASGGDDTSPAQTFTITVNAVNDAPSFTKGADQTLLEDAGAQSVSNWATAISKGPGDESAQTVSFTTSNDNNALFSVQPGVSPTGTLVYTPAPDAVGSATVTISLSDTGGTANGGDDTSDAQTFTITVGPVNDQPSFTDAGDQTVLEDAGARTVNGFVTGTSAGPADESAQTVTVAVTGTSNDALFSVLPSIDSAGTLTYTPAVDANGSATVTAVATDDGGTANGGDATGANETFTITVTPVNDAPSFTKGADQTLDEDAGAQSVSNWATAISKGPANESAQTVSFTVTNSNNGLFSSQPAVSPTGTLTYTSAANQYGTATVSVAITDNGGTANGGDDTSDVQTFTITVNPVNDAPVAAVKNFTVQANMKISLSGLLTGATDPNDVAGDANWSPTFTVGNITAGANCVGCTISNVNNANGTFDFDPPAGGTGSYSVTYTVVDNGHPMPGATSAAQTINFTVNGPVIWFVDADGAAGGTGRLSAPFNTLAAATTAMGTDTNERIFVEDGNVTGNVTLPTDGWLISDAATGASFDAVMGITPPAGTIARPAVGQTQRTLTGTVTMGTNSVVRGFNLTPTAGNQGLVASSKTGLTVNQMSITTTSARAVNLANSAGTFALTRVDASGADRGISLVNTNVSTGSFTISGTGTAGSGGTITGSTGTAIGEAGIHLNNTKNVSLDRMVVTAGSGNGIYGSTVETFTLANSTISNNGTNEVNDHSGLNFTNLTGTSNISAITVFGSREDNAKIMNNTGSATITVSNSTFRDNNASVGANGLYMDSSGSAAMTVTSTNNTFQRNHTSGLAIFGQATQRMNVTVTGGTYVTDNGVGLDLETNGSGGMLFNVNGGTVTGCANCAAPVVIYKGTGATGTGSNATAGTLSGMTVTNGNSLNAPGIWVHGEGPGASRLAITNNNVSQVGHYGIHVSFGNNGAAPNLGAQTVDVSVTGNTVNHTGVTGSLEGIFVDSGLLSADTTVTCANLSGNTITQPTDDDIRVRNRQAGTSLRLPGYAGGATDHTAVANHIKAQNAGIADAFSGSHASSTGIGGGAACATP